jgi:hypothetical protein
MICHQLQIIAAIAAYTRSRHILATISVETVDKVDKWTVAKNLNLGNLAADCQARN